DNRLREALLEADGEQWNVQYQSYDTRTVPALPDRLEMNNGEQRIKLKIDSWSLE
ncbi:MAG: lipoprotein insertase outer membrane protein LolB, partial [Enterobacteriaceae bacterium]